MGAQGGTGSYMRKWARVVPLKSEGQYYSDLLGFGLQRAVNIETPEPLKHTIYGSQVVHGMGPSSRPCCLKKTGNFNESFPCSAE